MCVCVRAGVRACVCVYILTFEDLKRSGENQHGEHFAETLSRNPETSLDLACICRDGAAATQSGIVSDWTRFTVGEHLVTFGIKRCLL